jgi:hypothetical protein
MREARKSAIQEGLSYPCGATWDGRGTYFAPFSANAKNAGFSSTKDDENESKLRNLR